MEVSIDLLKTPTRMQASQSIIAPSNNTWLIYALEQSICFSDLLKSVLKGT